VILTDREDALAFLSKIGEGIAHIFGSECEVVIHEMFGDHFINVAIYNGHISGREIGSKLSVYGNVSSFEGEEKKRITNDYINQLVTMPSGNILKSSTFQLKGDNYHFALGINYDITVLNQMKNVMAHLTDVTGDLKHHIIGEEQTNIEAVFNACVEIINKPIERMKKSDRVALVMLLKERGAFNMQKSVPYVADQLGISKYTVYNYLNEIGESSI
jgi:predicted transcriptional regulator YheO